MVQLQLLTATVKLFLKQPETSQVRMRIICCVVYSSPFVYFCICRFLLLHLLSSYCSIQIRTYIVGDGTARVEHGD